MNYYGITDKEHYLAHAGKKGMKWGYTDGVRNGNRTAEELEKEIDDLNRQIDTMDNMTLGPYSGHYINGREGLYYSPEFYKRRKAELQADRDRKQASLNEMKYKQSAEYRIKRAKQKALEILDKIKDTSVKAVSAAKESTSKAKEVVDKLIRRVKSDIASNRSTDSRKEPTITYTGSYITKGSDGKLRTVHYESKKKIKKKKLSKTSASRGYQFTLGPNGQTVVTRR